MRATRGARHTAEHVPERIRFADTCLDCFSGVDATVVVIAAATHVPGGAAVVVVVAAAAAATAAAAAAAAVAALAAFPLSLLLLLSLLLMLLLPSSLLLLLLPCGATAPGTCPIRYPAVLYEFYSELQLRQDCPTPVHFGHRPVHGVAWHTSININIIVIQSINYL